MAKPLSMNEVRARLQLFVHAWKDEPGEEKQQDQDFVRDLLMAYGVTDRGARQWQERATRVSSGRQGYIDAFMPGNALIEIKSAGEDLDKAEQQARDYYAGLPEDRLPRYLVCSDFKNIRLVDLMFTDPARERIEFELTELPQHAEDLGFLGGLGMRRFGSQEQEAASIQAAKIMGGLYDSLVASRYPDDAAAPFLMRLLFCLYADDSGMWEHDLFADFVETRTQPDGSDLGGQLAKLFEVLNDKPANRSTNLDEALARFPHVNGGIFDAPLAKSPDFDARMRQALLDACDFNWSGISPAVFGSLMQAIKSKAARRTLGEHYTTETNILKLIEPMFLDELRARFDEAGHDAKALERLRRDIGAMRFLDPACGCGNFLVIAYRELRQLDLDILVELQNLHGRAGSQENPTLHFGRDDLNVNLKHFHGIEIGPCEAAIANTVLHLIDHQANQKMGVALGQAPDPLPLDKVDAIVIGNALRIDWADVVGGPCEHLYVLGNPPFVGLKAKSETQKQEIRDVWGGMWQGSLDYVTAWYKKAIDLFARPGFDGEFAFVSTNSITQGEQTAPLFSPMFAAGWRIKFAHQTFAWTSEAPDAAAVHCVIIGFDKHPRGPSFLYTYADVKATPVRVAVAHQINGYLIDGPNVLVRPQTDPLSPDLPSILNGNKPSDDGNLIVEPADHPSVAADPVAAKYLRPFLGARELIHGDDRWCLWLTDLDPADVARSHILSDRLRAVRRFREESTLADTRQKASRPHLFVWWSHRDVSHLVIPGHVSETRLYFPAARCGPAVISSNANFTVEDPDGLAFAVISSSMFIAWQRCVGGRLKSDLRFNKLVVWNTFPLPALSEANRAKLIEAGQGVLDARALHPERSLADHYNPLAMDPALLAAHRRLDAVMDRAMGARATLPDNDARLSLLLANYQKLTATTQKPLPQRRPR